MNGITGRAKNFNKSVMYNFNNQSKPNCFLQCLIFFYLFYKKFQRKKRKSFKSECKISRQSWS